MEESVLVGKQFGLGQVKVEVIVRNSNGNATSGNEGANSEFLTITRHRFVNHLYRNKCESHMNESSAKKGTRQEMKKAINRTWEY